MMKYILSLWTFILAMSFLSISKAHAQTSLFIEQTPYESWILTKTYNATWLSMKAKDLPFTLDIKPYEYSMKIKVQFKDTPIKSGNLELDIGDFTTTLSKKQSSLYEVTLQPSNAALFIEELKKQKILTLLQDDNHSYTVSLQGIQKGMDAMEAFALDHYIPLPQPFSAKLDVFATMTVPTLIPAPLYPVFRQQAALEEQCQEGKNPQETSCQTYQKLIAILKDNHICSKEENLIPQAFRKSTLKTHQWVTCPEKS